MGLLRRFMSVANPVFFCSCDFRQLTAAAALSSCHSLRSAISFYRRLLLRPLSVRNILLPQSSPAAAAPSPPPSPPTSLLASSYSQGNYQEAQKVVSTILQIGLITGVGLSVILFLGFEPLSRLFSSDSEVLEICRSGTLFVAGSQLMNTLAFVLDGLYYGVSDFGYAAYSMVVIALISVVFLLVATPFWGLPGVWAGLFLFMTLRVIAGAFR